MEYIKDDEENRPSELSLLRGEDHEGFRLMIQRAVKRMQWRMKYKPTQSLHMDDKRWRLYKPTQM